jgi:uncharacterized protein (DUF1697 family)
MPVYICLLKGINVGGNKRIKMADLRDLLTSLGIEDPRTYLQSGNVVFKSDERIEVLTPKIETAIEETFGFHSDILIRTADELAQMIEEAPFTSEQLTEPKKLLYVFLSGTPDAEAVEALHAAHTGPEIVTVKGAHLYIYYPEGMGRSKLNNTLMERYIKVSTTGRNWNTVTKLKQLAQQVANNASGN